MDKTVETQVKYKLKDDFLSSTMVSDNVFLDIVRIYNKYIEKKGTG